MTSLTTSVIQHLVLVLVLVLPVPTKLSKAHAGMAPGGRKKAWIDVPCQTLRFDKLQDHENSVMHKFAVKAEVWQKAMQKASAKQSSAAKDAAQDVLHVICYLIEHNLPLDLFEQW